MWSVRVRTCRVYRTSTIYYSHTHTHTLLRSVVITQLRVQEESYSAESPVWLRLIFRATYTMFGKYRAGWKHIHNKHKWNRSGICSAGILGEVKLSGMERHPSITKAWTVCCMQNPHSICKCVYTYHTSTHTHTQTNTPNRVLMRYCCCGWCLFLSLFLLVSCQSAKCTDV